MVPIDRQHAEAHGRGDESRGQQSAGAEPGFQAGGEQPSDGVRGRAGNGPESGLEGRQTEDGLQILTDQQLGAVQHGERERIPDLRDGVGPRAEQVQVENGIRDTALPAKEADQQRDSDDANQAGDHLVDLGAELLDGVDGAQQTADSQRHSEPVDPPERLAAVLG